MANTKVTGDLIASSTIATGNIADNAVTSDKISGITTAHITEGSNLYYTDARARGAVSVSGNALAYNSSTGVITSNFEESPSFSGNVGIGVTPHGTASLNITNTAQHIRLNNGSELGIITLDTDGKLDLWAHGTGETINFRTGTGSGTVTMSVVGSNVGIGTTSPNFKLDIVNAAANTATYQQFRNGTTGAASSDGTVLGIDADGDFLINNQEAKEIKLYTSDTPRLIIQSGGNVGIGTTSPSSLLHLYKSSGDSMLNIQAVSAGDPGITFTSINNRTGNIFYSDGSTNAMLRYDHADTSFKLYAHNTTVADFVLNETTSYFPTQNVGIGTTSPNAKLHVNTVASGTHDAIIISRDTHGEAGVIKQATGGIEIHSQKNLTLGADEDGSYTGSSSNVIFKTDGTERTRINSSGNVSIGQDEGGSAFNGNSVLQLSPISSGNPVYIGLKSDVSNNCGILMGDTGDSYVGGMIYNNPNNYLTINTNNAERMRIDSSGNLSLATATSLNFNVSDAAFITSKESMVLVIDSDNNQTGRVFQIKSNGVNGDVLFSLGDNGQLGLGTTGPSERLHVEGRIRLGSTPVICSHDNVGIDIDQNNNSGSNYFRVTRDGEATELFRIQESGKTLIGITTEQNAGKLQIQSGGYENGGILDIVTGGWYRYYTRVCHNATSASAAGYWHIKTNIAVNSNTMFMAKFYGYIYGSAQILDLTHAGYAYSGTNSVINQATTNNGNNTNASSAIYASSNGNKVTFRIAFGTGTNFSTYFCGVMMDMAFPSPAGQNIDFEIEAQTFSTNTTVY